MYRTPKKPNEPRPVLVLAIKNVARGKRMTDAQLVEFLLPYFTAVDLKLILEDLRVQPVRE